MPAKKEPSLLPESENAASVSARLIRWLTTVGRFIIVFTELFVVLAFLSRFYFDRKNADISETVRQQKAILETTKQFESDYTLLQQRLKFIQNFNANSQNKLTDRLLSLSQSAPPEIVFSSLTIPDAQSKTLTANLTVSAPSQAGIVDFVTNLTLNSEVDSIDIQKIEKKDNDTSYTLNLTILFKAVTNG